MSDDRRPGNDREPNERGLHGGVGGTAQAGGESAMERLLREALAARATRITAQDLRPADPPKGPRNRRRPAYLVGLPLMGLAAATLVGVLTVPTDTLAHKGDDAPAATMSDGPVPTRGGEQPSPTGFPAPLVGETDRPAGGPAESPSEGPGSTSGPAVPGGAGDAPAPPGSGTGPQPSPPPGGPTTGAPSDPAPAATPLVSVSASVRPGGGVALSFDGLAGAAAIIGAGPTTFSVTWRNTTQQPYDAVAPVVSVRTLTGAVRSGRSVRGRLQREEEGGGWTEVPLTVGSGAYLTAGDAAAFPLAPGAARTVRFRLDPSIDSAEGTLLIEALALLPATPERIEEGSALAPLLLTSAPAAGRMAPELRLNSAPYDGVAGGRPSSFSMTVGNPGAAPLASVVPTLLLTGADAGRVVVETRYGAGVGMRTLPVTPDGSGQLVVDTSLLDRLMRPHDSKYFEFQISVPDGWKPDADFAVVVGARGDGRDAAPVVVQPKFAPPGSP
ncbi:hypothetical protein ACFP3U_24620 [Kitasatospora misakiensis]|uniref:Uncharacterized protein n=1 Tax=Kitasatospora misakiensis TaxID=67330 RepID=A0ABW0XAF8_9ACTN